MSERGRRTALRFAAILALVAATAAVYAQVGAHQFLIYDDAQYVSKNSQVMPGLTLDGVRYAFTTGTMGNWHPLTWLSLMLDCQVFGPRPGPILLVNLLLHIASTVLLLLVLERATGELGKSAFVAGLFALHPLHVESVAWIAERKDVLSTLFWMLAMGSYVLYAERPGRGRYLGALAFFAFGLMSKPMLVTFPFVLLLLDVWPLRRIAWPFGARRVGDGSRGINERASRGLRSVGEGRRGGAETVHHSKPWRALVVEKVPFFVLAAVSSVVALAAQRAVGAVAPTELLPLGARFANAVVSYALYLVKMVWPAGLAVVYPHFWTPPAWKIAAAGAFLIAVSALVARAGPRRPYLAVGWFWYLGTLVPVIGLVQIGAQALADRYTYVPLIGIFVMAAWGLPDLLPRFPHRKEVLTAAGCVVLALLAGQTWTQIGYWRNNMTLFRHALEVTSSNIIAHNDLGIALEEQGRREEAIEQFEAALRIKANHVETNNNLAVAFAKQGRLEEAIERYRVALATDPRRPETHYNLANVLGELKRWDEAAEHLVEAIRLRPSFAVAHFNLGGVRLKQGRLEDAAREFTEVLRIEPGNAEARRTLEKIRSRQAESG